MAIPTRVRAAALIVEQGRVLLVTAKSHPDHLVPPGGGLEADETLAAAVEREVLEEAGLVVTCGPLVAYREVFSAGRTQLELYFAARLPVNPDFTESVSEEARRVRWVPLTALPETAHFPEQLGVLCEQVATGTPGATALPPLHL